MIHQIYIFIGIYAIMIAWGLYMSFQCAKNTHYMKKRVLILFVASNCASFSYFCSMISNTELSYDIFSSLLFISIDFTVLSLFYYLVDFTSVEQDWFRSHTAKNIINLAFSIDVLLNLTNPITHLEVTYEPSRTVGNFVLFDSNLKVPYMIHLALCYIMVLLCVFILIQKCLRTPKAYRKRYFNILLMFGFIVLLNTIFLTTSSYLIFDFSYLLYGFCAYSVYKNTFYFSSSPSMNNSKRLILEYLNSPVALFDYEEKLNDCNEIFLKVFPEASNYRNLPISLKHFEQITGLPLSTSDKNDIIPKEYTQDGVTLKYHCHINPFHDESGNFLGHIVILNDVTKELRALEEAENAGKVKSAFLSSMSHEIRTPINAVLGMDELILRESTDPQILEYAGNIENAGKLLLSIVNDILDISKMESGSMNIVPTNYNVLDLIHSLHAIIDLRAKNKGLKLKFDISPTLPKTLFGDETRIQQCITNLLTNAVKYTPTGSIKLSMTHKEIDETHIILYVNVSDTGIGIKPEDIKKLFHTFQRLDETRNRNIEGTGLGLHLTSNLVKLMGGSIHVDSVYGKGSTFTIEIPQTVVDATPIPLEKAKSLANSTKYQVTFTAPDAHILVVDDNKVNLAVFRGLLKNTKIHIDMATSGFEALEKIQAASYDLIFLDHMMPEMDGIECLQKMKLLKENLSAKAPVIVLTANVYSGAELYYMQKGFSDYLSKPIDTKLLEEAIVKYLPSELVTLTNPE